MVNAKTIKVIGQVLDNQGQVHTFILDFQSVFTLSQTISLIIVHCTLIKDGTRDENMPMQYTLFSIIMHVFLVDVSYIFFLFVVKT